ncbi:MAG: peptidoglycan-binding protein [Methanobacteriaceae archaeon]|nr:peptidoglycan-binding protein [Methanobacteriaceae archaeon]
MLSLVIAAIPIVGASDGQKIDLNDKYSADGLKIGVTSQDVKEAENVLQNNKPFGEKTSKVLGNNTNNQSQILKLGASGEKVKEIQQWLTDYGYYKGNIDGEFGASTDKAVRDFQTESGLIVDGIVGNDTKKAMETWDKHLAQVQAAAGEDTSTASTSTSSSSKKAYASAVRSYSNSYSSSWSNGKGTGDCWDNSAALYSQLTSSGSKARIVQYANSYVSNHRSVEVWDGSSWVDYDYKGNGYAQRYYATSHDGSAQVIASS